MPSWVSRPTASHLLCTALFAIFAGTTLLWLYLDRTPPSWDDAWYLKNSLTVYDSLTQKGVLGYVDQLNSVFGFKAPLIAALPAPFYLLFGRRWHAAYLVNIAAMLVLFLVMYRIACRSRNPRTGVFAIAIAGTMPLLYGLARWYLVEYALAALVASAIAVLMESESLDRRPPAVLFGVLCGLGLLLKAAFGLFLLPPFLYAWTGSRRRIRSLLLSATPCLILALPWYVGHLRPTLANAFEAGFGLPAAVQGTGAIFSVRAVSTYLANIATSGVSIYYAVLAIGLIVWAATRKGPRPRFPALFFFWLLPFVIFLFGGNKDIRYIAPILPAFALLASSLLDCSLPRSKAGSTIGALLLTFPIIQMIAVSFGVPYRTTDLIVPYARRFSPAIWSHDEILRTIAARIPPQSNRRPLVLVGADRATLNANNVELTAAVLQLPLNVDGTAHERDFNILLNRLGKADFFVYEDGGEAESAVFDPYLATLVQHMNNDGLFTEIPFARRVPDGGVVRLFRRPDSSLDATQSVREEFVIEFGGLVALTSEVTLKMADSITFRYRWRPLRSMSREYWSFTHLVDQSGRIVAQSDQRLPLSESGAPSLQEIRIGLPASAPASGLRLKVGIYDPPSGARLRVAPLPPAAASRFALTDQDTALIAPY